jgi:predicted membrane-bound dolichyl-phosphate-mannose-protein mannosyltransferase
MPALFGIAGILFFYLICRELKLSKRISFIATFVLSVENLTFIQSSVAMLDVFSVTLMLASFWAYLKRHLLSAGIFIGLSALSKLSGALGILVIAIHWLLSDKKNPKHLFIPTVASSLCFITLMPFFDYIVYRQWLNPFSQIDTMLSLAGASTFFQYPSEMLSRPWEWVFKPEIITYSVDPQYIAMISPTLWIMIIPVFAFMLFKTFKGSPVAAFVMAWIAGTYLFWIPTSIITDRISYIYYFYPTVGAFSLGIAIMLSSFETISVGFENKTILKLRGMVIPIYSFLHLAVFVLMSPVAYIGKLVFGTLLYIYARINNKLHIT